MIFMKRDCFRLGEGSHKLVSDDEEKKIETKIMRQLYKHDYA